MTSKYTRPNYRRSTAGLVLFTGSLIAAITNRRWLKHDKSTGVWGHLLNGQGTLHLTFAMKILTYSQSKIKHDIHITILNDEKEWNYKIIQ